MKKPSRKSRKPSRKSKHIKKKSISRSSRKLKLVKIVKSPIKKKPISRSSRKLKLVKISKSPIKTKKYRACFNDDSCTDFGAKGYQNYGGVGKERHLDKLRKSRYIERHKRNEDWTNPKKAGTLSRYVLWNKDTFGESVRDYKKRFRL